VTRRLVLTADDLGREAGTTEVITGLLADGLITATTLITVTPHAADAARRAREAGVEPRLHATLTSERGLPAWHPLTAALSLVDAEGALPDDPFALGARADAGDVLAELDAQLAWMHARGLAPVAADSHAGTLYGLHGRSWLAAALEWCARHRLAFRLPRDPAPYLGGPIPPELAGPHRAAVALADGLGVPIPDVIATNRRPASDLGGYEALRRDYLALLAALPEGTSEIFLHPSAEDAVAGPDGAVRVWEARLLRDPVWLAALEQEDVELVSGWWDEEGRR
jgi:chitin disaccharide deacetylase